MAQQLNDKVELRGETDLLKIQQLLEDAVERHFQDAAAGDELTEGDQQELRATSVDCMVQLRQLVVFAQEGESAGEATAAAAAMTRSQLTPAAAAPTLAALRSPLLQPLSPPPVDAEVQQLELEVNSASLRVAELRTSMQARLQEQLAAKLAACRPTAQLEPSGAAASVALSIGQQLGPDGTAAAGSGGEAMLQGGVMLAQNAEAEAQQQLQPVQQQEQGSAAGVPQARQQQLQESQAMDADGAFQHAVVAAAAAPSQQQAIMAAAGEQQHSLPLSPHPQELQQRLLQAANRMPSLRARLEQATDKLQRVVTAVAADINRAPPNTVEKAVQGKTPGRPAASAAHTGAGMAAEIEPRVSPLFQQALASGQISTRRRAARDVQPVPYSQQQE